MATTPQEAIDQVDEAFNRADLDAVLSYYDENAVWVVKPGNVSDKAPKCGGRRIALHFVP